MVVCVRNRQNVFLFLFYFPLHSYKHTEVIRKLQGNLVFICEGKRSMNIEKNIFMLV